MRYTMPNTLSVKGDISMTIIAEVKLEKEELDIKFGKLTLFLNSTKYMALGSVQKDLLQKQWRAMNDYSLFLRNRLIDMRRTSEPKTT